MKTKTTFNIFFRCVLVCIAIIFAGCDFYKPKKSFRFAIPKYDVLYDNMYTHIKALLEQNGYEISVVYTDRTIDANQLVAEGKADLAFINNVSSHVTDELGLKSQQLRTILPLTQRAMLAFSHTESTDPQSIKQVFENKVIGVEKLHGEGHGNVAEMLSRAHITCKEIVQRDQSPYDVRVIWGSAYGKRALQMLDTGWHAVSFDQAWIDFQTLSDPALEPLALPALPGDPNSITVHTVATNAVLVVNKNIGEHAVYLLAEAILQGKLSLVREDPMYRSISESINPETLLYPLHEGTSSYMRRDTPTFLERYADTLALVISIIALLYGVIQSVKNYMRQIRKDHLDEYFLEFLDIRSKGDLAAAEQIHKLNDLFQRALLQMTHEKMEKGDFHIFSRLIQQELMNLRLHHS